LRKELEARGFRFRTNTDTEVLLHGYAAWGESLWSRLNGMFAFALWDRALGKMFLVRDRFGVKPLYYASFPGRFLFASEVKALLPAPGFPLEVDWAAFDEYFTFQNIFSDRTLFDGVRMLPAGTALELDLRGGSSRIIPFWRYPLPAESKAMEERSAAEELRARFEQAVDRQLMSDVPVGAYMSGGMDSGSIVAVAARRYPGLPTFTGGFLLDGVEGPEAEFDERSASEVMARHFGTDHHERVMGPESLPRCLEKLVWHLEDLRVGMSWQNYLIAQMAGRTVKVVLAGTGGDELFAGYPWRYAPLLRAGDTGAFKRGLFRSWQRLIPDEEKPGAYADGVFEKTRGVAAQAFEAVLPPGWLEDARSRDPDWTLSACLHFEFRTFLQGLFVVEDKLSMAHSLESRVPFLDNDLVAFAQSLPSRFKMEPAAGNGGAVGFGRSTEGKYLLRQAMRGLIPEEIRLKAKQGFSPPDQNWYRGPNREFLRDTLLSAGSKGKAFFRPDFLDRVVAEHEAGRKNHRLLLWSLMCFEMWGRSFGKDLSRCSLAVPEVSR